MLSSKLNLVLLQILLFIFLPFCFSSCVSKETKIKRLCKKWVYSPKTINEKKDRLAELSQSSSLTEQLAGAMGQGVFKMMETSIFEFEGNGNYTISNSEDGLSVLLSQTGSWEFDGLGTIIITLNNKKERYEVKELTEKTLILSYIKEGQEVVEGFVPFVKENVKKQVKTGEKKSELEKQTSSKSTDGIFLKYPTEINHGELFLLKLKIPHGKEFGIVDPSDNFFYVVYSGNDGFVESTLTPNGFENLQSIIINTATLKGTKTGESKSELIFNESGVYRFIIGDNLESDSINEVIDIKINK